MYGTVYTSLAVWAVLRMQQQSNGVLPESGAKDLTDAADVQELGRENARLQVPNCRPRPLHCSLQLAGPPIWSTVMLHIAKSK